MSSCLTKWSENIASKNPLLRQYLTRKGLSRGEVKKVFLDRRHTYRVEIEGGEKTTFKSVTKALSIIDKPALMYWSARMAGDYMKKNLTPNKVLSAEEIDRVAEEAKKAHRVFADRSAELGTRAHQVIEMWLKGSKPKLSSFPPEVQNSVNLFFDWWKGQKLEVIASEEICWHSGAGYAGTADFVAKREDGSKVLIDFKTGNGIYIDHALQVSAYWMALRDGGVEVDDALILRIGREDMAFEEMRLPRVHIPSFFSAFALAHFLRDGYDISQKAFQKIPKRKGMK